MNRIRPVAIAVVSRETDAARLADASLYAHDEIAMVENGSAGKARWVARAAFRSERSPHGPPLYPDGLAAWLDRR